MILPDCPLVEVIRIVKSKRLFETRMNTCKNCDEESKQKGPSRFRLETEVFVWSRLAQAEGQSDCENSVRLIGAWATHILSSRLHPSSRSHRVRVFDPTQILLLISVVYVPTVLVSAQPGSRYVRARFPETFLESGICRFSGGDTRFSCERADRL